MAIISITILEPRHLWFTKVGRSIRPVIFDSETETNKPYSTHKAFRTMARARSYLRYLAGEHPEIKHILLTEWRYHHKRRILTDRHLMID